MTKPLCHVRPVGSGWSVCPADHPEAVAVAAQPAAPQGVAYAEPSEFPAGAIVNGRTHIDRLESFYSFDCEAGPLINCDDWHGLKRCFEHLAERASHGQAPAGAADEMEINRPFEDPAPPFNQWRGEMQSALKRAGVYAARSPGAGNKLTLRWRTTREDVLPSPTAQAADLHPKTADLVQRFSAALADKLAAAEKKYGYSDGWMADDWMDECRQKLMEHITKGDPRDVAAYCAFLWHHGASTAQAAESVPAVRQLDTDEVHGAAQNLYWGKRPLQDAFERGAHWGYRRGVSAAKESAARAPADSVGRDAAAPTPAAQQGDAEDAQRYRHLRDCNSGSLVVMQITGTGEDDWHVLTEDDADAAIDASRAALAQKEGK